MILAQPIAAALKEDVSSPQEIQMMEILVLMMVAMNRVVKSLILLKIATITVLALRTVVMLRPVSAFMKPFPVMIKMLALWIAVKPRLVVNILL